MKKRYKCKCGGIAIQTVLKRESNFGTPYNINACYCKSCKTYYRVKTSIDNEIKLIRIYKRKKRKKK